MKIYMTIKVQDKNLINMLNYRNNKTFKIYNALKNQGDFFKDLIS